MDYAEFLAAKAISDPMTGLAVVPPLPACLFDHQRDITAWALRRGRSAVFAGTGLGKSLIELAWGAEVAKETMRQVIHFAPLAVTAQLQAEADKFGITPQTIVNYQRINHHDLPNCGGVILDESSILKSVDGHYRSALIAASARVPFRLAATATPAPNDFMELGNHAEFLGVMSYTDMLATFFTHDGGETQKWRLKGHAENEFWRWMASWAVMLRKPSDLGYSDEGYDLPPLRYVQHQVSIDYAPNAETGLLFPMQAETLQERISARRATVADRCGLLFKLVIGSYGAKLAEWLGNQNTPREGEQNTNPTKQSASDANLNVAPPIETRNTCENITSPIHPSSNAPQSSKPRLIGDAASDTQPTMHTARNASNRRVTGRRKQGLTAGSNPTTEWTSPTTDPLSQSKMDDVPFAELSRAIVSTLTTAMTAAESEGSFAVPVTLGSVISRMTRSGLTEPWCIWCNLNSEQEYLAKVFGPLAFSVTGSMPDEQKQKMILDWIAGDRPVMLSKPTIMGFGMNFQHCRKTAFVGLNDSFEQFYQAVRRFWRFGQTKPVTCHIIASELEGATVANIRRKEADAERMAASMVMHMADLSSEAVRGSVREVPDYNPTQPVILPRFLEQAA